MLRPFSFTVRRGGRRVLRNAGAWVADGSVHDHFIQFTEGVVAPRTPGAATRERATRATPRESSRDALELKLHFDGGRGGTLCLVLHADERFTLSFERGRGTAAARDRLGPPIERALRRPGRPSWHRVRPAGPSRAARARTAATPALTARRRCSSRAASRRATARRCRGCCRAGGYGVIAHTYGNGTRFDMSSDRTSVSTRALAGPLELEFMCQSTPAARLRALCRADRLPAAAARVGLRLLEEPRHSRGSRGGRSTTTRASAGTGSRSTRS